VNDLLLRTLRGEEVERRPLWIMRQAGRFLPEYRALRAENSFEELCADPELAADVTLMPIERFALDAAIVFADLVTPASALGIDFHFDPGPVIDEPLRTRAAIEALSVPADDEIAPTVAATHRIVKERLAGRASLIGFVGAPFSLAAYLVEGRGRSGFPTLRRLLYEDPVAFDALMTTLVDLCAGYGRSQHAGGADVIQVFDSWAGLLDVRTWTAHVRPHLERLLTALGDAGIPRVYFAHDAPHLADAAATLPTEALALCWRADLPALRKRTRPDIVLQGNLDPTILLAGPEATTTAARDFLARMPARRHVMNLGHGILPETPLESVQALIEVLHSEEVLV
jgi:uroporphyrinogen decarboxylase